MKCTLAHNIRSNNKRIFTKNAQKRYTKEVCLKFLYLSQAMEESSRPKEQHQCNKEKKLSNCSLEKFI